MANDLMQMNVKGHVKIEDDLGNVLVDKDNAVHPQNMSRVIARALSNESNYFIHRIAFGNGGTQTNAAFTITYNTPNDGQPPDTRTWDSRLYTETYSEVVNESDVSTGLYGSNIDAPDLGTDPGSFGPQAGSRPGGGADPSGDPASIPHVSGPGVHSNELGLTSEVVITSVLNPGEPTGQFGSDDQSPSENTESSFTFDEIGLYTTGAPAIDSNGSQYVDVGNRTSTDYTGLTPGDTYDFNIVIDGGATQTISFTVPLAGGSGAGGEITYGDLCQAINTGDTAWNPAWSGVTPLGLTGGEKNLVDITDTSLNYDSIELAQTFGFLRFTSAELGAASTISLAPGGTNDLFAALNPPTGGTIITPANDGEDAGVQNNPVLPLTERERLLTHIIFSPVLKSANRTLTITYTLTVSVARTQT